MRILVVEDEIKIARTIKKGLENEAFSVDIVHTGTDGYDLASTEEYAAIVLDLMLPEMDGLEICEALRKNNINTPVLMLTARNETETKIKGLNYGADDYLTKPFSFEELVARIRALLRRPKAFLPNTLVCNDLKIDTTTFTVTRKNKEVDLSKKEFALLEYLARNKNKVLSKKQIIDQVWEYDADVLPNSVEVYIGYLRNKIDKPFPSNLIKTIRGFGYKLECE